MQDDRPAASRFAEDPALYAVRTIRDRVRQWPGGFLEALGSAPLTQLYATARVMLRNRAPGSDQTQFDAEVNSLFGNLYELAVRLRPSHEWFVLSAAFLPVAAEVYQQHTALEDPEKNGAQARLGRAERWLRDFAAWFGLIGGGHLPVPTDPSTLWTIFKRDFDRKPKSVFLALSFREEQTLRDIGKAMKEAIRLFNSEHPNSPLNPVRVDEQRGASYEIPARVFENIDQSSLVIADLTDEKPNVYCEVGYAKSRGIPFVLTFHKKTPAATVPWERKVEGGNRVHFDLAAFRYIAYDNPLHLRDLLKAELDSLFESSQATAP